MGTRHGATTAGERGVTEPDDSAFKYAMLSVYYASIGDRFAISGAPSAFVPPEVAPMPLAEALAVLADDRSQLDQALWQIVRNTPIRQAGETTSRYPPEIDAYLDPGRQARLDRRRAAYRKGASLLAACLRACHHDDRDLFDALRSAAAAEAIMTNEGFRRVLRLLFDETPEEFLDRAGRTSIDDRLWSQARQQITAIESEVSLGIAAYVERLASTAAYDAFLDAQHRQGDRSQPPMAIYPVASPIQQSTDELWTCATVTTLAHGDEDILLAATDPANWHDGSDVIETSYYVDDPVALTPGGPQYGEDGSITGLIYEVAAVSWGRDRGQQGVFRNVLNVSRKLERVPGTRRRAIDIRFSLCRSISSSVLWDDRAGGITMNEGFMRVVPLGGDRWRVTSRKLLRFSDRTPYSGTTGWADFGQMLNYLAPAALSWWVETETYSLGRRATSGPAAGLASSTSTGEDGAP
ncbi:MAG TPA: hypothetical protein VFU98_00845 [Microlunatus sp.]|nr:hypothetical protein [Microlunatus sp.]